MIIEKAKKLFIKAVKTAVSDKYDLLRHVPEAEKWANRLCDLQKEADREVVLLAVWLHDIGHYPICETDHAVKSEKIAKNFLIAENYPEEKMEKVLHCIRSHRNRDVKPETLEAKIIACIDSASHMTDSMYIGIVRDGRYEYAKGKIERDYRDLSAFPEIKKELTPLYKAWKELLTKLNKYYSTK